MAAKEKAKAKTANSDENCSQNYDSNRIVQPKGGS